MTADARKLVKFFIVLTLCLVYTSRGFRLKQNIIKQDKQGYKSNKKKKTWNNTSSNFKCFPLGDNAVTQSMITLQHVAWSKSETGSEIQSFQAQTLIDCTSYRIWTLGEALQIEWHNNFQNFTSSGMFSGLHDSALYQSHPLFLETWCCVSINSLGVLESTTAAAQKTSLQNIIY